jgi:predicted enzyme related to lactoylglutathione lyase
MTPGILVNIDVEDLERATAFYTGLLEVKIGRRLGEGIVELVDAAVPIYLIAKAAGSDVSPVSGERRRYKRHWTPVHLDFIVADLDRAVDRAVAAGASLDAPAATHVWGRIAHLADPFGNGFCLIQFLGRGYDEIATG